MSFCACESSTYPHLQSVSTPAVNHPTEDGLLPISSLTPNINRRASLTINTNTHRPYRILLKAGH